MAPAAYNDRDGHLEAGLLKNTQGEKHTSTGYQHLTQKTQCKKKMIYLRRALLIIAVGFVLGLGVVTARPNYVNCHNSKVDVAKAHASSGELAEALQKASPDLLHRLLHAYLPERYQHGVFPSDREAIDAIHGDDPSVASAIIKIAKRQDDSPSNNNSTLPGSSTATLPPSSTDSVHDSSTAPPQSTTDSSSSVQETSTESSLSTEASTTADSTTSSPSSTSTPASTTAEQTTTSDQTSTAVRSTTAGPSSTEPPSSTTSAPESTTSDDSVTSTSSESSNTPQTTITSGTKTTSAPVLHTLTRTLPDGGTTTLTSTSWVAVIPTSQADGSKSPSLQNGANLLRGGMALPAVIGLLVGAVLMV